MRQTQYELLLEKLDIEEVLSVNIQFHSKNYDSNKICYVFNNILWTDTREFFVIFKKLTNTIIENVIPIAKITNHNKTVYRKTLLHSLHTQIDILLQPHMSNTNTDEITQLKKTVLDNCINKIPST